MKTILPSNGLLGTKWLDLREPTLGDLRAMMTSTTDEYLFKYELVSRLSQFDPKTITMDDVLYLYDIVVSAITFNTIKFKIVCDECGEEINDQFSFIDDDIPVVTLHKDSKRCKKKVDDVEYVFHILSAADGVDIYTYAYDDTENERMIEEATACKVLGYDITEENIEKIRMLPVSIYVACFLFLKANKHGMVKRKKLKCPKCGEKIVMPIELNSSWARIDLPVFIAQFARIHDCLDFRSFLAFTLPEYKNFVEYLNAEAKKNEHNVQ